MSSKIHADYDKVVTKKDLTKVFLREITYEHTWNYERMGNVGFCFSMYPVLKKLYPDKKDLAAAMKRHLTLYQPLPCNISDGYHSRNGRGKCTGCRF